MADKLHIEGTVARERILEYLMDSVDRGKHYFKSKHIAKDLGLSPKEVGTNLSILLNEADQVNIEKWGYSKSTTWRVDMDPSMG